MAHLKPGTPFIYNVAGKAGSGIYRKSIPGPAQSDSLEENAPAPGRQRRKSGKSKCNCEAFRLCDSIYTAMPEHEKQIWRNAVTKAARTGYTVWMSECMHLMQQGLNAPDMPGPGGGWSPINAIPGAERPPPESCIDYIPFEPGPYFITIGSYGLPDNGGVGIDYALNNAPPPIAQEQPGKRSISGGPWQVLWRNYEIRMYLSAGGYNTNSSGWRRNAYFQYDEVYGQKIRLTVMPPPMSISVEWVLKYYSTSSGISGVRADIWSIPSGNPPPSPGAKKLDSIEMGYIGYYSGCTQRVTFTNRE